MTMSLKPLVLVNPSMKFGLENGLLQQMFVLTGLVASTMATQTLNLRANEFPALRHIFQLKQLLILIELLICLVLSVQPITLKM